MILNEKIPLMITLQGYFFHQRYKDSNLEMTESESVALLFGDSAIFFTVFSHSQKVLYYIP